MMTETEQMSPTSPTSTSSNEGASPPGEGRQNLRKSNKPLMEKKRRARINVCLNQLKSLVLSALKKDNSQYSKLEKADILEMTVRHLRNVQRCQPPGVAQTDGLNKYRAGFNECAQEVIRYLGASQGVDEEARARIMSHLASILTPVNSLGLPTTCHTPILPAPAPPSAATTQHQQLQQQLSQIQNLQHHYQQQAMQQQQVAADAAAFSSLVSRELVMDRNNNNNNRNTSLKLESSFVQQSAQRSLDLEPMNLVTINTGSAFSASTSSPSFQGMKREASPPHLPPQTHHASASLPFGNISSIQMQGTTQYQLVPNTLPSGQVALVLAPQPVAATKVFTPSVIAPKPAAQTLHSIRPLTAHNLQEFRKRRLSPVNESPAKRRSPEAEAPIVLVKKENTVEVKPRAAHEHAEANIPSFSPPRSHIEHTQSRPHTDHIVPRSHMDRIASRSNPDHIPSRSVHVDYIPSRPYSEHSPSRSRHTTASSTSSTSSSSTTHPTSSSSSPDFAPVGLALTKRNNSYSSSSSRNSSISSAHSSDMDMSSTHEEKYYLAYNDSPEGKQETAWRPW